MVSMFPVCLSNSSHSSDFAGARIGEKALCMMNVVNTQRGQGADAVFSLIGLKVNGILVMCHSW